MLEQFSAFLFADACGNGKAMIKRVGIEVNNTTTAPCHGVLGSVHHTGDSGIDDGTCTHGTGLQGHVQGTVPGIPMQVQDLLAVPYGRGVSQER